MKYMEKGGFQNNPLMKLTLLLTLLFLAGFWLTNVFIYFSKMGLSPSSVVHYYLGSEADFKVARSAASMLEVTHAHLPMMAMVILLLTHLVIFAPYRTSTKIGIIFASFFSALLGEASGWLVRFVSPSFALLKVFSFVLFQSMLFILIVTLGSFLIFSPSKKKVKIRNVGGENNEHY
ncbi:MAG: hypothetical protein KCHDKBKB_02069 [Elusimicrobia bacterium]|nr:hypothetical protein [Elusimicrobiota bacterium]